jgi:hypothetical protein
MSSKIVDKAFKYQVDLELDKIYISLAFPC